MRLSREKDKSLFLKLELFILKLLLSRLKSNRIRLLDIFIFDEPEKKLLLSLLLKSNFALMPVSKSLNFKDWLSFVSDDLNFLSNTLPSI